MCAAALGFQQAPPGDLAQLDVPHVWVMATVLWVLETWAERRPLSALGWNLAQGLVRPLAAGLLALLLVPDAAPIWRATAAVLAGAVALWTQAARTGWRLLLDLAGAERPPRLVVSAAEDAGSLALVALLLDTPVAAAAVALLVAAFGAAWSRPSVRAYRFGLRLVWGGTWGVLEPRRWDEPARFPRWLRRALSRDPSLVGGGLRGTRAGALAHPGVGTFHGGWVVVRGGSPLFLYRRGFSTHAVDLGAGRTLRVETRTIHNRVELDDGEGRTYALCFPWDGPRVEGLEAEFMV